MEWIHHVGDPSNLILLFPIQSHLHQLFLFRCVDQPVSCHVHADHLEVWAQLSLLYVVEKLVVLSVNDFWQSIFFKFEWILQLFRCCVKVHVAIGVCDDEIFSLYWNNGGDKEVVSWRLYKL